MKSASGQSISRPVATLQGFGTRRLALAVAYLLVFAVALQPALDSDTWWHLRAAEQTLAQGMIRADPFSFTRAGQPWLNHSWGGQLFLLGTWQLAGATGLSLLTALLATLGVAFVGRSMAPTQANAHLRAYLLALVALTAAIFWSARPQMFSFVGSALTLYLLQRGGRARGWLPLVFAIWANLHAGFVIGLLWLLLAALGDGWDAFAHRRTRRRWRWRRWLLLIVLCLLALCLNPYGPELLLVPLRTLSLGELQRSILEWQTPDFHQPATWPFLLLLTATLLALALSRRRPTACQAMWLTAATGMALWAGRNIALFAIVAGPILAAQLAALPWPPRWRLPHPPPLTVRRGLLHAVMLLALALALAAYGLEHLAPARVTALQEEHFPAAAIHYLRENAPAGPLFHAYEWGGYLLWHTPEYHSFVDGRTLLFGDELLARYRRALAGREWAELFAEYNIRLVLIPRGSSLDRQLRYHPATWEQLFLDETAVLYARRGG